jgi:branched-chain amino acid transport system substrate-binding protein
MKRQIKKFGLIVILLLNLLATACNSSDAATSKTTGTATTSSQTGANPQTIRIYASLPLSGSSKNTGQSLVNAMRLALEDVSGGTDRVGNFKIEFVPLDNSTAASGVADPTQEAANANKAASDSDAMLYLGPTSTATAETAIPILNKAGLTMISPGTTYPGLTKTIPNITKPDEPAKYYPTGTHNYFRLLPTDELQGRVDASYTEAKLQVRRVFVVEDGSDYGVGLAKAYELAAGYYNLDLLGHASLTASPDNSSEIVNQLKTANPEAIFYSGNSRLAGQLVKKVRTVGIQAYFLGGGSIQDDTFIQEAGTAAEGVYSSISGTDSAGLSPKGTAFLKAYRDKFSDGTQSTTIYGYDAMSAGLAAIKQAAKKDRKAILQAVASLKNFTGASGRWSFDQNGDTSLTVFAFYQNKNQKWVFDSVADTSPNPQKPSNPIAVSDNSTPTPASLAATPTPASGPAPTPTRRGPITLAPGTPVPSNKRVDAVSKLPPSFRLFKIDNLPVAVYVPPAAAELGKPLPVLVALHGMFSNGGDFGNALLEFAQRNQIVLIAPTFNYNVNYKDPEIITNEDLELTARLTQVFKQLPEAIGLKVQDKVLLFGFSRGAQLAHHFAMFYPNQISGVAVLSAGAYTLPLTDLNSQPLPFPFGLDNFEEVTHHNFDQAAFVKIPFDVQVGARDNDPTQVARPYDRYIGNNRETRAVNFYHALIEIGVTAQFEVAPNTQHEVNAAQLQPAEQFLQRLLQKG